MMLGKVLEYLFESVRAAPEVENLNLAEGKLSLDKVRAVARQISEEQKWYLLEPRKFELIRNIKTGKKIWQITYFLKNVEEEYVTGTMAIVVVDDETGEVISKGYVPH